MPQRIFRILAAAALATLCNGVALIGQQMPEPKNWTAARTIRT